MYESLSPMRAKRGWSKLLLGCFAFSSAALLVNAGSVPKLDRSWKRYVNAEWGYCVSYPDRWRKGDAFEGSGMYVETGVKKRSSPLGEMDIAVIPNDSGGFMQDVQMHLDGLKKFERAQHIEELDQRQLDLFGTSALLSKERYYDPLDRAKWVDEIVFTRRANRLYRLELECRADQLARFEPVFTKLVGSFQFDCVKAHSAKANSAKANAASSFPVSAAPLR